MAQQAKLCSLRGKLSNAQSHNNELEFKTMQNYCKTTQNELSIHAVSKADQLLQVPGKGQQRARAKQGERASHSQVTQAAAGLIKSPVLAFRHFHSLRGF